MDSIKIESMKEEKKREAAKPAPKPVLKAEPVKEQKEKQPKPAKEKQPKEKVYKEKPAKEKFAKEKPAKEKPVKVSKPIEVLTDPEEIKEVENRAVVFLKDVFDSMKLGEVDITSKYNISDGCLEVDFEGEDLGILIGKRGQTLDSLQYLTSLVVNKGKVNYIRVEAGYGGLQKTQKRNSGKPGKRNCL